MTWRPWYYAQVLSIDICIGVMGSGAFAKTMLKATMKPVWWFLLPASVWVVYTADHLMDASKIGNRSVNLRHKFHYNHFVPLVVAALITAITCIVLAFMYLREIVVVGGIVMGGLAVMHIVIAYWGKVRFGKEISVAIIYACGVWFAPYLNRGTAVTHVHISAITVFVLGAILNLFMNSVLEYAVDRREDQVFGLAFFPRRTMRTVVITISFLCALVAAGYAIIGAIARIDEIMIAGSLYLTLVCLVPGLILYFERFFAVNQRYRIPAELVFSAGLALLAF
jgi:hypothetical protein